MKIISVISSTSKSSLRDDMHKKVFFFSVEPLREGGRGKATTTL